MGSLVMDNFTSLTSKPASNKQSLRNEVYCEPLPDKVDSARFIQEPGLLRLLHEAIV